VVKRARHNSYNVKQPHHKAVKYDSPAKIEIVRPQESAEDPECRTDPYPDFRKLPLALTPGRHTRRLPQLI
jgi:hypothetical protein